MDVIVRFWNTKTLSVESWYLDSRLVRRPNANNLAENIVAAFADLDEANLIHLSMERLEARALRQRKTMI